VNAVTRHGLVTPFFFLDFSDEKTIMLFISLSHIFDYYYVFISTPMYSEGVSTSF
jgi:hypothetical protein